MLQQRSCFHHHESVKTSGCKNVMIGGCYLGHGTPVKDISNENAEGYANMRIILCFNRHLHTVHQKMNTFLFKNGMNIDIYGI